jgi:16S rRNA (guanine1207-N2)-methyltransferase
MPGYRRDGEPIDRPPAAMSGEPSGARPSTPHYFDPSPTTVSAPETVTVELPDTSFTLRTDRGVFGHGKLDTGTSVLLRAAPALPTEGVGLDLGCGAGAIALTMARRAPALHVWAVDVNQRARALCTTNAAANGVRLSVIAPEHVPDDVRFDVIWSNPPIRIGKAALHELLLTWLARLTPDGRAVLVVQKHLGADSLHRWLVEQGHPTTRLASAKGYRVLDVHPST